MKSHKKTSAVFSYLSIFLNLFTSIFFTPFLISSLGDAEYGLYKVVQSFASQLSIMSFGIGTLVTVMIAKYNAKKESDVEKENFLAMEIIVSATLTLIVLVVGCLLLGFLDSLFDATMTKEQIALAKKLYFILVVNTALVLFRDFFSGIIRGNEKYAVVSGLHLGKVVFRVVLLTVFLLLGFKSLAIVSIDLLITVVVALFECLYSFGNLKTRIRYHYFDKTLFVSSFKFSSAIFLQTIVTQVNQTLDNVILGATVAPTLVTVYSVALTIYTTYGTITGVVSGLFLPKAARMIQNDATSTELTDLVIYTGRYQFFVAAGVLAAFTVLGKQFICLWVGPEKIDAYYIALILLYPVTLPLIQSVANSILDAKLKRMGRSLILILMVFINIATSLILIKYIGYFGAAIGTAIALLLGNGLMINIYYKKVFGFQVKRFFIGVSRRIVPSAVLAALVTLPFSGFLNNGLLHFLINSAIFIVTYCLLVYFYAANEGEKLVIDSFLKKIARRTPAEKGE